MSQPLFERTASTEDAAQYAQKYNLDFIDLHFREDEANLQCTHEQLERMYTHVHRQPEF